MTAKPFSPVEEAIEDIRAGRMVVVCDAEDRENEGDLTMAAQFVTPEAVNFMATHGRVEGSMATWMVRARSAAEMPVVTPWRASIETVNAVPMGARFSLVIMGS